MLALVSRGGREEVRYVTDPVPLRGELLLRTLSAAVCESGARHMDHPNFTPRFARDPSRDVVLGHEFVGEVIGHGPECSDAFPVGTRVTSIPLLLRGEDPLVIGSNPDAPGGLGEFMLVTEVLARAVPDEVSDAAATVVYAFAEGEYHVRSAAIAPGAIPIVLGAGAAGLTIVSALAARGIAPIIVADESADRLEYARAYGADILVDPVERSPFDVWRELARERGTKVSQVIFECSGAEGAVQNALNSCEVHARIHSAGGWRGPDSVNSAIANRKAVTIAFGGGPHPHDWYNTLDALTAGRLDPLPGIRTVLGLRNAPDALRRLRKKPGPPLTVIRVRS